MNRLALRRAVLGLAWPILASFFFVISISLDIKKYYVATDAIITGKNCQDHSQIRYSFNAEGQEYNGAHAVTWCESAVIERRIKIYYNILDRNENTPNDPRYEMNNRTIFTAMTSGFFAAVVIWLVSKSWRFGKP